MNLLWIAAIAIFVLLDKTIPFGDVTGRVAGAAMILAGVEFDRVSRGTHRLTKAEQAVHGPRDRPGRSGHATLGPRRSSY
jgi:hypothetical protein